MSGRSRHSRLPVAAPAIAAAGFAVACACGPLDLGATLGDCGAGLLAGDVVLTEFLVNPSGDDKGAEYVEIHNTLDTELQLLGTTLLASRHDGSGERSYDLGDASIGPGGYLVLGGAEGDAVPEHVDLGYGDALGLLRNEAGRLALRCDFSEVDSVIYDRSTSGRARQLDGSTEPDHELNDSGANWCDASSLYDGVNRGSPGAPNEPCVGSGTCMDDGEPRTAKSPESGDLVISEVMANPDLVGDDFGEWFEIAVLKPVDLNGLRLGRDLETATASSVGPECLSAVEGDHVLFARSDVGAMNGDLSPVAATFDFGLVNSHGQLSIALGDELLDTVSWTGSRAGVSMSLDPSALDPVQNDDPDSWCAGSQPLQQGGSELGSPGIANPPCDLSGLCFENGVLRPIVVPQVGDVTVTEFMPNPAAVADSKGEWFEVHFASAVDLNGLALGRSSALLSDGTTETVVDDSACISVPSGALVVFARSLDPQQNGGISPVHAQTFDFSLAQTGSSVHELVVAHGDLLLDVVQYTSGDVTAGAARSRDPVLPQFCDATSRYGDPASGDFGTPGQPNPPCP